MSEKKIEIEGEEQQDQEEVLQYELSGEQLEFLQEVSGQSEQVKDFIFQDDQPDFSNKNLAKLKQFTENEIKFLKIWRDQPVELQIYAEQLNFDKIPDLVELTQIETQIIKYWSEELSEEVKDFLREERKDVEKEKFSEKEILFINNFYKQSEKLQQILLNEQEDEDDFEDEDQEGWESENSFTEDGGLEELSEKDLAYIELFKQQPDKVQNCIIEKKKIVPSNFTKEQKQFVQDFKKQSKEIKYFVGAEFVEY